MTTLLATAILAPILMLSWKLLKEGIRDCIRDRMFALRDAWRMHHEKNGLPFDSAHYQATRKVINGYIRGVGRIRLSSYLHFKSLFTKDISDYLHRTYSDNPKKTSTPETVKLSENIEEKLYLLTMLYMFTTTVWFIPFFALTLFYMLVRNLMVEPLSKVVRESVTSFSSAVKTMIPDRELVWMSSLI